jgi:hypothetical protein
MQAKKVVAGLIGGEMSRNMSHLWIGCLLPHDYQRLWVDAKKMAKKMKKWPSHQTYGCNPVPRNSFGTAGNGGGWASKAAKTRERRVCRRFCPLLPNHEGRCPSKKQRRKLSDTARGGIFFIVV